ncbi:regulator of (H+)-ATPase in vacuolar membrane [Coemansia sp. RSA 1200]|nr:regulator of (H+)-ATPase in vacuolar membrane [Coemansia sp. RSA 1200]
MAATEKSNGRMPYFISTVRISDRTIQTWEVPVDCDRIEYVGCSSISHASHFDLASRVMPVSYPFFSLDNILATFDANSGKLRIWGVRTTPKLVWFCSKEHLIPCMNVKMIRYNSIDKAAIVSAEEDGTQVITVWVFSSTSRESHYLPAGTIYPRRNSDSSGEPIFSVEKKLVLCSEVVPNSSIQISDAAFDEHGELPMIHPFVLIELLSWGKIDIVKQLLSLLYDYMRQMEINGDVLQIDDSGPDFGRFNTEKAEYLLQKLTEIKIKGITAIEQARLMSIVGTISASLIKDQPLDDMGLRYLLKLHLLEIENKRKRSMSELPYRELNWALHSSSQAILLQACLQQHASSGLTWESARRMGLFMWLSDTNVLHSEVEKMARNMFIAENRDPTKCAIFYLALKKKRLLHGLWRTAHNHPEHNKMLAFLSHDFSEARWKTAAAKNAYVLLSRQRYMDAATFFMLSDKLIDAARICITQLKDTQLAITICRCYEGENGPVLKELIWKHVLPDAFKRQDRWLASLAFGIIGKYDLVLQSLTDDLSQFSVQIGVDAQVSAYSPMNVLDTELLILYRNILGHSPHYRAPLVVQAQLIASTITIFECLGVPMMALVVLEWWRRELYDVTKKLELKPMPLQTEPTISMPSAESTTNSINTGTLDMSVFSGFAGFSPASSSNRNPSAVAAPDPISSGMLSMDGFGSSFSGMTSNTNTPSSNAKRNSTMVSTGISSKPGLSNGADSATMDGTDRTPGLTTDAIDDATLAMDIEDTPVQYACRVMLALQIADYVRRVYTASADISDSSISSTPSDIALEKEIRIIADTLRLPLSVFPSDHE